MTNTLRKTVRRLSCLRKYPNGLVYTGRGRAFWADDQITLARLRAEAKSIGLASRAMLAAIILMQSREPAR